MPLETPNLNSGDVIPEGYFGMLYRDLKSLLLRGDGKCLFVENTPNGQVIRFRPQGEQSGGGGSGGAAAPASPICAIVTGGNDLVGYSVQLYPNGYDQPGIGVGTAFLLQGNAQLQTIPIGTKIMVYPYNGMLETLG